MNLIVIDIFLSEYDQESKICKHLIAGLGLISEKQLEISSVHLTQHLNRLIVGLHIIAEGHYGVIGFSIIAKHDLDHLRDKGINNVASCNMKSCKD